MVGIYIQQSHNRDSSIPLFPVMQCSYRYNCIWDIQHTQLSEKGICQIHILVCNGPVSPSDVSEESSQISSSPIEESSSLLSSNIYIVDFSFIIIECEVSIFFFPYH